ncbi:MAG TPA: N-acyl homoserine lactonase family protein [Solirubrobacterales bacterium]|nr:N-acyl homoserine lactonase family protein [Solirubrobacterales bacterium]
MKVHVEPRPLTDPLRGGGAAGTTVAVEPLKVGEVSFPRGALESTGGSFAGLRGIGVGLGRSRWVRVPCQAFLIRHPDAGQVVVDTGLHPSVTAKPAANLGRIATWYAKPKLEPGEDLPAQLRRRNLDPRAVRTVVMTHLHVDHASGMSELGDAAFVVTEAEWRAATTVSRPLLHGYRPAHYDYAFDYRTVSYDGPNVTSYSSFGRTFDLLGDGSIRLVSLPGHTLGHQAVLCRLRDRDLVIAGDAIYTHGQLGSAPLPPRAEDPHTYRRSLQALRQFHRRYPQAVIIPGHDPDFWDSLDERYE